MFPPSLSLSTVLPLPFLFYLFSPFPFSPTCSPTSLSLPLILTLKEIVASRSLKALVRYLNLAGFDCQDPSC